MIGLICSTIVSSLLDEVLKWLKKTITNAAREGLHEFLKAKLPKWRQLAKNAIDKGLEWGWIQLHKMKDKILSLCSHNQSLLSKVLVAGSKSAVKKLLVVEVTKKTVKATASQAITKTVAKSVLTETTETAVKRIATGAVTKTTVTKSITGAVVSNTGKTLLKVSNPVGYAGDVAQLVLEQTGHPNCGKAAGAGGNLISGAMTGGALGGPPGALVGGLAGLGLWFGGEVLGSLFS